MPIPEAKPQSATPREQQVLELVRAGKSISQIASILNIAVGTVKLHKKHCSEKGLLNLSSQGKQWSVVRLEQLLTKLEIASAYNDAAKTMFNELQACKK